MIRHYYVFWMLLVFQIQCFCGVTQNLNYFWLVWKKVLAIIYSLHPQKWRSACFTRGRNVCCAQLFSSYHCSPQPPPHLSSFTLHEGRHWAERARHYWSNFLLPPLLKGQQWHTSGHLRKVSHHLMIITGLTIILLRWFLELNGRRWSTNSSQLTFYWTDHFCGRFGDMRAA